MKIYTFLLVIFLQIYVVAQTEPVHATRTDVKIGSISDYEQALAIRNEIRDITFSSYDRFTEVIASGKIDFTQFPNLSSFRLYTSFSDSTLEVKLFRNLAECNLNDLSIHSNHQHDYSLFSQVPELRLSGRTVNNNSSLTELKNLTEIELYYEYNGQVDSSDVLFGLTQIQFLAIEGYSESTFPLQQIGKLIGLKQLYIETDDTISEIPKEWQNLEKLQRIELRGSFNMDSLPAFFYQNQSLRQIEIENKQLPNISAELFEKPSLSFTLSLKSSSSEVFRAIQLQKFLDKKLKYPFKLKNKRRFQRKLNRILNEPIKQLKTKMPSKYIIDFEYLKEGCPK